jgi:hypothetical protein
MFSRVMENENVPPQEARKFVFASKLSRDQTCILISITIPNFIDCKSGLRNGLAKKSTANYRLGFKIDDQVLGERVIVVGGLPISRVQMVY